MLKEIGSVFSFLTIFPSSNATLENIAKYMYVFPVVGIIIGLLIGSFGFGLSFFLDPLLVSLLVVASIAIVTGIHHADGLADFADGLMVKGSRDKKIKAMKDLSTGSAGIVGIVLYLVGLIITISLTSGFDLFKAILISEILAKFSMVLMASLGNSASLGSNSPFVKIMKDKKKLTAAFIIMIIPVMIIGESTGLIMLGVTVTVTIFLLAISTRSFGGITGDVLGATNELTRLASLMVFVSI
ncbi:MAG TPA: adenosylcobinamide-GDP ribazoletransferase [Nitrosopumilus sp.]|jgi:adenosylcobinamide-GDP ribazoletransferase|nr:adenosylcobinamide-GDP ribazoletransferase [Nitrosopumilus sp.]HJL67291.1 adenosylcobinamide-GDP ribazoletransferase [Nitrosopumilus sp.]HJM25489.1 adenosylcobinamide-GDP ribazoletransferase [Nitrosopumilus sp.]HJO32287.1 adenosylcobinamide-GDP ribazoletransferase [Nitrosopumilus sp.]|tara:strand:- start:12247 stop:12972 length:726 start_codon:yes stop_codon:yes gene_type:complete